MDVQDLLPTVSVDSRLIMDDISVGPGCVMKRLARRGVLRIEETFGPFDAPSPHNPCMRSSAAGRSETCAISGRSFDRILDEGVEGMVGGYGAETIGAGGGGDPTGERGWLRGCYEAGYGASSEKEMYAALWGGDGSAGLRASNNGGIGDDSEEEDDEDDSFADSSDSEID